MATEQDGKELSMAEILASIKKILADNELGKKEDPKMGKKDLPSVSLPFRETGYKGNDFDSSVAYDSDVTYEKEFAIKDKVFPNENEQKCMPYLSSKDETLIDSDGARKEANNVSDDIINSFARMFEQNDYRRHTAFPQCDADALLRQIVSNAVSEKLDNKFLQNAVKETIVPVLEEWLSHYLPKLVAEEVERVMVKTGRR